MFPRPVPGEAQAITPQLSCCGWVGKERTRRFTSEVDENKIRWLGELEGSACLLLVWNMANLAVPSPSQSIEHPTLLGSIHFGLGCTTTPWVQKPKHDRLFFSLFLHYYWLRHHQRVALCYHPFPSHRPHPADG